MDVKCREWNYDKWWVDVGGVHVEGSRVFGVTMA